MTVKNPESFSQATPSKVDLRPALQAVDRIVVPVQGTDREFEAQQWAVEFAAALGVPVHAVHVAPLGAFGHPDLFRYVAKKAQDWGIPLTTRTLSGTDPVEALVDELSSRDLVVIGTRRMKSVYHLGSVAAELVRRAPCPVQIVRIE